MCVVSPILFHSFSLFLSLSLLYVVNNFQSISAAVTKKQDNEDQSLELARMKEELHIELVKHDQKLSRYIPCPSVSALCHISMSLIH